MRADYSAGGVPRRFSVDPVAELRRGLGRERPGTWSSSRANTDAAGIIARLISASASSLAAKDAMWRPGLALGYAGQMTDDAVARVQAFIGRLAPEAVCDDCVAHRLELADLDACHASGELAGSAGFERRKSECSLCGAAREVTRLKPRS